jgi:hypothetical protein
LKIEFRYNYAQNLAKILFDLHTRCKGNPIVINTFENLFLVNEYDVKICNFYDLDFPSQPTRNMKRVTPYENYILFSKFMKFFGIDDFFQMYSSNLNDIIKHLRYVSIYIRIRYSQ